MSNSTSSRATYDMDGVISSLILGVPANTKTIDMTTVQKFILSGDWSMSIGQGKLTNFNANFYTVPVNGAIVISNCRTISISLDDNDTQRHFMDQQIYGIVKKIKYV